MEKKDKDILKKGLEETSFDFTAKVMNQLDAEETALSTILSKHGAMETSQDFTLQLMSQLEGKSAKVEYTPVISKAAWIGIAAMVIGMVVLIFAFGADGSSKYAVGDNLKQLSTSVGSFFTQGSTFMYLLLAALVFSIALIVEQRVSHKESN
jgi:formate-dependent nitrite reductase membrane component NrfD